MYSMVSLQANWSFKKKKNRFSCFQLLLFWEFMHNASLWFVHLVGWFASVCTQCSISCTQQNLLSRLSPLMDLSMKFGLKLVSSLMKGIFGLMVMFLLSIFTIFPIIEISNPIYLRVLHPESELS